MKVLDVTEFYSERGGGVRSHLEAKSHVLCQRGDEHVVVAPGRADDETRVRDRLLARSPGSARIIRVRGPNMPYDPTYHAFPGVRRIREIVARERPDVLEIHSPYMGAIAALGCPDRDFGVRTFRWHSDFLDTYASVATWKLGALPPMWAEFYALAPSWLRPLALVRPGWRLVRALGERVHATLVASEGQRAKLTSHGVPRVRHVPFGVDLEPAPADRGDELRQGRPGPLLVGVGRFALEKRWEVVLEASAELARSLPHTLVLFGDGPERARLERLAGPHVRMPGFEKDRGRLASALASADALVHGCSVETFGLSIAEALAQGLPVVVPDEGGAAELARPEYAETYPSGDARACAEATSRLLGRPKAALSRAARARVAELPSAEGQFDLLRAVYTELLARA
ncbi:MAG: glycosyltransferase [Myxococcales bacterium]|nr:glycosyltransferase [Myxococcales bacterium]MBL0198104.1 glycosyltransferase [Myxococcales bacterium]